MKKGITLISLVITIVILIILAGVAISLAVDSDGLFSKAEEARDDWNGRVVEEQTEIESLIGQLDTMINKNSENSEKEIIEKTIQNYKASQVQGNTGTLAEYFEEEEAFSEVTFDEDTKTIVVTFKETGNSYTVLDSGVYAKGKYDFIVSSYEELDAIKTLIENGDVIGVNGELEDLPILKDLEITFIGIEENGIINLKKPSNSTEGSYSFDSSTVCMKNIKIVTDGQTYTGWVRARLKLINCTIENVIHFWGDVTAENCTFNQVSNAYNLWTWGASEGIFTGCTFNSAGKAMLVYNAVNQTVTLNNCEFYASEAVEGKSAIEIDSSYAPNRPVTLNINNCKASGFSEGSVSGNTLWNNKTNINLVTVFVNGVQVQPAI